MLLSFFDAVSLKRYGVCKANARVSILRVKRAELARARHEQKYSPKAKFPNIKKEHEMGRTLKDSFRFNRYSTYRQEEDRECFYTLCPLFFASTAFVVTNAIIQLSICRRFARLDIFALRQIRYAFATLKLDMI